PLAWPLDSAVGVEAGFASQFPRTLLVWIGSAHSLALGYCRLPTQACVCFVTLKESFHYQKVWPECSARMSALEGNVLQNSSLRCESAIIPIRACGTWACSSSLSPPCQLFCCRGQSTAGSSHYRKLTAVTLRGVLHSLDCAWDSGRRRVSRSYASRRQSS